MAERWSQPAELIDIEQDPESVWETRDGRSFGGLKLTVTAETEERMRTGWLCMNCLEPFDQAWPILCPACGVRVREQQGQVFARRYRGVERLPSFDYERERAEMVERDTAERIKGERL